MSSAYVRLTEVAVENIVSVAVGTEYGEGESTGRAGRFYRISWKLAQQANEVLSEFEQDFVGEDDMAQINSAMSSIQDALSVLEKLAVSQDERVGV
jgi:hypothetical protein